MTKKDELQKEVIEAFKNNDYSGSCILPTGTGKARIMVEVLKKVKPKTCWYLCDSTTNRDETFINELKKWGGEKYIDKIEFMCYQTAYKLKGNKIDLLLGDEVDFALTTEYIKTFHNNTFKRKVLVSATAEGDKRHLLDEIEPIIYERYLGDIEGEGIVNTTDYYIVKYMLTTEENFKYLGYNAAFARELNAPKRNQKTIDAINMNRNLFLNRLASSLQTCKRLLKELYIKEDSKILIFCGVSSQADKVCKYSYHSNADNEQNFIDFDEGKIRILSVVGKVDRGANINGVNHIVYEAPFKSKTKQQQKSGRGRRLHIDDKLHIYFLIPYYKDKQGKVKPTIVNDWVYKSVGDVEFKPQIYNLKQ